MDTATSPGPNGPDPAREAANRYGRFSPDGSEYWITDPKTPRPWVNVIANPRLGLVISQAGGGFTWIDNSQLAVITRWQQDLLQDSSGKFLYLRDTASGEVWSLSPAPTWPAHELYRCRHGLGYTTFETVHRGIAAQWTLFVHASDPVEFWRVELRNLDDRPRSFELTGYLEWNMGVAPSPRREFTKLFLETSFDAERRAVFARSEMWEVPSPRWGHWNTEFPYVAALACTERNPVAQGDRDEFVGRHRDLRAPQGLGQAEWRSRFGRHGDAVAALRAPVQLAPGELRQVGFVLAVGTSHQAACELLDGARTTEAIDRALDGVRGAWRERLVSHRVATTEPTLDF
jgi:cellobiose phosphorylase